MALTSLGGNGFAGFFYPEWRMHPSTTGAPSYSASGTLNDSDDSVNIIMQVPKTGTLDWFEFRTFTVTTFPGNGLRLSFQDVNTAFWYPDGTVDQYRTITVNPGANAWAVPPGVMTNDGTNGGSKRSVNAGDYLACVIDFLPTFTTGNLSVAHIGHNSAVGGLLPYINFFESSQVINGGQSPNIALKYDDGTYAYCPGIVAYSGLNTHTYNSSSTPDEHGMYFELPLPMTVAGVMIRLDLDGPCDIVLYDPDSSVLASVHLYDPPRASAAASTLFVPFDDSIDLDADTGYRVAVKPTSTTNLSLFSFDTASTDILAALPGGTRFYTTTRADGGSWSQTNTRRPFIALHVTHVNPTVTVDEGSGAAGVASGYVVL